MLLLPAKNQPWKSKQELSIAIGIDDQATNTAFNNKVASFKKGHCQTDSFLSPSQGYSVGRSVPPPSHPAIYMGFSV